MGARGFTLSALAQALGATLEGDPSRVVAGVAALDTAGPDDISFLIDPRYRDAAQRSRAGAFLAATEAGPLPGPVLRAVAPQHALIELLRLFHPEPPVIPGIHGTALVAGDARVDPSASVGPFAVVDAGAVLGQGVRIHALAFVGRGAEVGEGSEIHPRVVLYPGVRLGARVIVHAGAVIGADGFGYAFDGQQHRKIPQVGTVVIEDDVEVGANTTIDRAMLGATVIRRGTKLDNLVQVGHNVEIGPHAILVAQAGVSGSSRLGHGVVLGGQVGVADHVTIEDGAMIGAQSGIHTNVAAGEKLLGTPARPITQAKRIMLAADRLPELARKVRELERRLAQLETAASPARTTATLAPPRDTVDE